MKNQYDNSTTNENVSELLDRGWRFYDGDDVKRDVHEAVKWFRKAAEQEFSVAQILVGECYEIGLGVDKDKDKAAEWYQKAADVYNSKFRSCFGWRRYEESTVLQCKAVTLRWYELNAD